MRLLQYKLMTVTAAWVESSPGNNARTAKLLRTVSSIASTPAEEALGFCCPARQGLPEGAVEERIPSEISIIHPLRRRQ